MKIAGITLAGFKCFSERVSFNFDREPGLYFLTGRNDMRPELGANAVGKSSLLDAISWCLYGKTLRKLKAADIEAWSGIGSVSVTLDLGGNYLRRSRKPNYLGWADSDGLELQPQTQADVDAYVGMSFEMFTNAIMFGQFNRPFLDLMPAEKEKLFSEALELDTWLSYSEVAGSKAKDIEDRLIQLDKEEARLEGELDKEEATDYSDHAKKWEVDHEKELKALKREVVAVTKERGKVAVGIAEGKRAAKEAREALDDIAYDLRDLHRDIDEMDRVLRANYAKCSKVDTLYTQTEKHIQQFEDLEGRCSLCGQEISEAAAEEHLDRLDAELAAYAKERKGLRGEQEDIREEIDSLRRQATKVRAEQDKYKERLNSASSTLEHSRKSLDKLSREEKALIRSVSEQTKKSNPFDTLEIEREESLRLLGLEVDTVRASIEAHSGRMNAFKYWVRGFRNVRLYLMDERLAELELEANNVLTELGLSDWRLAFTTERKIGRGGKKAYRPGFFVRIDNGTERSVPWEAWSGGESQRLRLAGSMGFASLILNHAGIEADIEFWDEPSSYLSEEGIEDLLDALYYRARDKQKQIWIIDHRALEYGGFAETVTVTNDERGSYFEN